MPTNPLLPLSTLDEWERQEQDWIQFRDPESRTASKILALIADLRTLTAALDAVREERGVTCHHCNTPVQVVQAVRRAAWGSVRWPDAPVVECVDEYSVCPACKEEFLTPQQSRDSTYRLWKATIPALYAKLETVQQERDFLMRGNVRIGRALAFVEPTYECYVDTRHSYFGPTPLAALQAAMADSASHAAPQGDTPR